jgi:hypothetical protein
LSEIRSPIQDAVLAVVVWLVLAAVLPALAPRLANVEDNRSVNDPPAAAESMRAAQLLHAAFPDQRGTPALVVVARPGGHLSRADLTTVAAMAVALSGPRRPAGTADAVVPRGPGSAASSSAGIGSCQPPNRRRNSASPPPLAPSAALAVA